jgi:hypothetical protein
VEVYPKAVDIVITSERSAVVDMRRGSDIVVSLIVVSLILRIWCFAVLFVVGLSWQRFMRRMREGI